jgi:hypothetical protein
MKETKNSWFGFASVVLFAITLILYGLWVLPIEVRSYFPRSLFHLFASQFAIPFFNIWVNGLGGLFGIIAIFKKNGKRTYALIGIVTNFFLLLIETLGVWSIYYLIAHSRT